MAGREGDWMKYRLVCYRNEIEHNDSPPHPTAMLAPVVKAWPADWPLPKELVEIEIAWGDPPARLTSDPYPKGEEQ